MEQERVNTMDKEEAKRIPDKAAIRARDTNVPSSFDADNHVGRNGAPILSPEERQTQLYGEPGTLTCHHGPCNRRNVNENDYCSYFAPKEESAP